MSPSEPPVPQADNSAPQQYVLNLYPDNEETPEASRALLKREVKLWGDVVRANQIAAQ
jgi:hypothetical protein